MVRTPQKKEIFYSRTAILTVFLLLFFLALGVRLFKLQVLEGNMNRALAENQHNLYKKIFATRGEIKITDKFSNQAYAVATNIKHYLVYAVPSEIQNPVLVSQSLGQVLGIEAKDIVVKITNAASNGSKYVPIKKQVSDEEQQKIAELKLPGIYFDSEDARYYPEKTLLSNVLGFVGYKGDTKTGLYGLESFFQDDLSGKNGSLNVDTGAGGSWIFGGRRDLLPAMDGTDLILTIDKTVQFKAESVIKNAVTAHGADSGSVIIANPKTGAILAMASYPDYNPNEYNKVTDPKAFFNQATMGSYEPGSTFKAITMASALDEEKIKPESTYVDTGKVEVDNYTIKNAEPGARGVQTMTQALDFSLNTGAIFAQNLIGNQDFFKYVQKFGFGKKTGIELPEAKGNLDNLRANITVNFDTASFGQGITVTPLQMIQAYSALANDGKMMKPFIVQSKIKPDGSSVNTEPQVIDQVISSRAAHTISAMLVDVVENGFGKKAGVPGYYIGGKTGTSQVVGKTGKYDENNNIGSFIGYGPIENPQFLMIVRVDHPRDVKFAETTAAPAFGEIAKFMLDYYNIPPTRTDKK